MLEHFVSIGDHDAGRLHWLLGVAAEAQQKPKRFAAALGGRTAALSLDLVGTRSRVTFIAAMARMGGAAAFVPARDLGVRAAEQPDQAAALLSRLADVLVGSFPQHALLERYVGAATVPVINGGTGLLHPCQALADLYTLRHLFSDLAGLRVAWIGPASGELHELLLGGASLGLDVVIAAPDRGQPDEDVLARARERGQAAGGRIQLVHEPREAVRQADAVYASPAWSRPPWGPELPRREQTGRVRPATEAAAAGLATASAGASAGAPTAGESSAAAAPEPWRVGRELLAAARPGVVLLHGLPVAVDPAVQAQHLPDETSAALLQAQHRVPVQQALLLWATGAA